MASTPKERHTGRGDLLHMAVIGATTTTHHVEVGQVLFELGVLPAQFSRVAAIEFGSFVQFGVAFGRGIGA